MHDNLRFLPRIRQIYIIERTSDGFTAGLFLFVYAKILKNILLTQSQSSELITVAGISASPSIWGIGLLVPITLLIALFEILTGIIADKFGPRFAVVASWIFRSLFFFLFGIAVTAKLQSETIVLLAYVSTLPFAIGYTLRSGANQAWLHWALTHHKLSPISVEEHRNAINSRSWAFYWFASLIGSLVSTMLHQGAHEWIFAVGAVLCVGIALYLGMQMENYLAQNKSETHLEGFELWHARDRWVALFLVGGTAAVFMVLADTVDHTWLMVSETLSSGKTELRDSLIGVTGIGIAAIIGSMIPSWIDSRINTYSSYRSIILFLSVAFIFAIPHVLFGMAPGIDSLVAFLVAKELVRGAFDAPKENLIGGLIPSKNRYRATIISSVNQVGNLMVAMVVIYYFAIDAGKENYRLLIESWMVGAGILMIAACSVLGVAISAAATIRRKRE